MRFTTTSQVSVQVATVLITAFGWTPGPTWAGTAGKLSLGPRSKCTKSVYVRVLCGSVAGFRRPRSIPPAARMAHGGQVAVLAEAKKERLRRGKPGLGRAVIFFNTGFPLRRSRQPSAVRVRTEELYGDSLHEMDSGVETLLDSLCDNLLRSGFLNYPTTKHTASC